MKKKTLNYLHLEPEIFEILKNRAAEAGMQIGDFAAYLIELRLLEERDWFKPAREDNLVLSSFKMRAWTNLKRKTVGYIHEAIRNYLDIQRYSNSLDENLDILAGIEVACSAAGLDFDQQMILVKNRQGLWL